MFKSIRSRPFQLFLLAGLALSTSLTMLFSQPAYSCSCASMASVSQALTEASVVFAGQVTDIETRKGRNYVTFTVEQTWKGNISNIIVVQTPASIATCGYEFEISQSYLVYGYGHSDRLQTNQCSRTARVDQSADDISELNQSQSCS